MLLPLPVRPDTLIRFQVTPFNSLNSPVREHLEDSQAIEFRGPREDQTRSS
jgi:hypothetical protein